MSALYRRHTVRKEKQSHYTVNFHSSEYKLSPPVFQRPFTVTSLVSMNDKVAKKRRTEAQTSKKKKSGFANREVLCKILPQLALAFPDSQFPFPDSLADCCVPHLPLPQPPAEPSATTGFSLVFIIHSLSFTTFLPSHFALLHLFLCSFSLRLQSLCFI